MIRKLLPRIYMIIEEIERRFKYEVEHRGLGYMFNQVSIIKDNQVHMAHLAIVGSHAVNGVAKIHTEILINDVMAQFAGLYPGLFSNKTNGITHRRWLMYSNPQLTNLLVDTMVMHG